MAEGPKAADVRMTIQDLRRLEYVAVRSGPKRWFNTEALRFSNRRLLSE